jgi:hypothetical protein
MSLTSADAILGIADLGAPVVLHVPEWGDDVLLRRPTANDRDAWELYCQEHATRPKSVWRAKLAAMLLCDADNRLLFTQAQVEKLGEKSAAALNRIWEKGLEMMRITKEEIYEIEKNS